MNEERIKILEMLSEGAINTDEAIKLLDSFTTTNNKYENHLDENYNYGSSVRGRHRRPINQEEYHHKENLSEEDLQDEDSYGDNDFRRGQGGNPNKNTNFFDFAWVKDMDKVMNTFKENFWEMESNISASLDRHDIPEFFGYNPNDSRFFTQLSTTASQGINSIECEAKNSKFELVSYDGNEIELLANYTPKRNSEPVIAFIEDGGNFRLDYDINEVRFMNILLKIPKNVLVKDITIKNKNGIILIDDIVCENLKAKTSNSPIKITNVESTELSLESKNAIIKAKDVKANNLWFKTSNSSIIIKNLYANEAHLFTTNSTINCNEIDIRTADLKTSNGSIVLNNLIGFLNLQHPSYKLNAKTSMGEIYVNLPIDYKIPYSLKASTSMSNIENNDPNFLFNAEEVNNVEGYSIGYENSNAKYDMELQTSCGKIRIETKSF